MEGPKQNPSRQFFLPFLFLFSNSIHKAYDQTDNQTSSFDLCRMCVASQRSPTLNHQVWYVYLFWKTW
jgi:hypothetical protein